jgi:hypothetical protein
LTALLRAPAYLYDWGLGGVLGRRFVRLTHAGRRSGRCYRTMLEVIGEGRAAGELFVMVGLGHSANENDGLNWPHCDVFTRTGIAM